MSKRIDYEPFSDTQPPENMELRHEDAELAHHPMSNEDFRKFLMTPQAPPASSLPQTSEVHSHAIAKSKRVAERSEGDTDDGTDGKAEKRKKKKKFYASLNWQQEDKLAELAKKHRDRAKERRDNANPDYQNEDPITSDTGYKAVAPDRKSGLDAVERHQQMIQESKFLGGDMKHTHLVKGLDYALLQKVRSEILSKEEEEEFEKKNKDKEGGEEVQFRTKLGKKIYQTCFKNRFPERNEMFLPNRMAYIVDLEDENAETDIPTTLIRSKADCPTFESQTTLTTNDIVINKLTQVLSYLRLGLHNNKGKKKEKGKANEDEKTRTKVADDSIFGDIGEYVPSLEKKAKSKETEKNVAEQKKKKSYFEKRSIEQEEEKHIEKENKQPNKDWLTGCSAENKYPCCLS